MRFLHHNAIFQSGIVIKTSAYDLACITSMVRVGEGKGELREMVNKLADFYEDQLSESVNTLTARIAPFVVFIVTGVAAVMLDAMYLLMHLPIEAMI